MIQRRTILKCADNSGVLKLQCIGFVKKGNARGAEIGEVIVCSVKEVEPRRQFQKGDVVRAVVVRQAKPFRRSDGSSIRFFENAAVIIGANNEPVGNRVFGPIPIEIKERGFTKIANLAQELV